MVIDLTANEQRAEAIVDAVRGKHGKALRDGDLEFLRQRLTRASEMLAALDRVHLTNSDEPDLIFQVVDQVTSPGRLRS